jgi:penicillin-binding protein 1C
MKLRGRTALLLVAGLSALAAVGWVLMPLPERLLRRDTAQSLTLTDRYGRILRSTRSLDGSLAWWVRLEEMSPAVPRAFVAVEDRRFYRHWGVDWRGALRAARDNLSRGHVVSGASTITMQLARLLRPIDRSWSGKVAQVFWAWRLEAHLTKGQILEEYLNRVPLGQGAAGVGGATALYFGNSPEEASLGQAALLAALARAPSSQNPLISPSRAARRRRLGLERLAAEGYASPDELARADREPLVGLGRSRPFLAPHFTSRVLTWAESDGRVLTGTWHTSLDLALQEELEGEVRHTVAQLGDKGARQAALVVLRNDTGELLAWVGSPDFWADTAGQVDMVVSPRQPGSALKPFLYALAFDRHVTPATVLADIPLTFQTATGPYHPRNYDRRYHGPVRAREALASSYNVPAVGLADQIGFATLHNGLRQAGFASLDRSADYYGLGLSLGNGDVTLLELANGYRALANGGEWRPWSWWASPGGVEGPARRFVSRAAALQVLDILADPVARIPAFGPRTPFDWPFRVAAKTGTSRHFTDNWAVAATGSFTVAVWVGNFSGQPMEGVSGITGAGPLLHRAVLVTARRYRPGDLPRPADAGLVPVSVCRLSGMRATAACPSLTEWFIRGTEPAGPCDWHQGGAVTLPAAFADWAARERGDLAGAPAPSPARLSQSSTRAAGLTIVSPREGDRYQIPPGVDPRFATVPLRAAGVAESSVRWYVDGRRFLGARWPLAGGVHTIRAETGRESSEVRIVVD